MAQAHPDSEVIIAGGGPVGLCLALLLSRAGVTVQVFEAEPEVSLDLRASTFHPPTLDMLEPLGVTADLLAQGLICPQWQIRLHPDGDRAVFDLSVLSNDTRHPYRLQCEQWKLSLSLLEKLQTGSRARSVVFNASVVGLTQSEDSATVTIETPEGRQTHRAQVRDRRRWRAQLRSAQSWKFRSKARPIPRRRCLRRRRSRSRIISKACRTSPIAGSRTAISVF